MKKRSRLLLAGVVLAAALSIGALAADEPVKGGIYNISGSGATLIPQTKDETAIPVGKDGNTEGYYANAVRMGVEATGLEKGKQYLLLVLSGEGAPTEDNIAYIDQAAAGEDGKVSFNAYPSALTSGTTYRVYIVGGSRAFSAGPAATFQVDQKYTLGDVDNDGYWTANDALYTLQIAVNKTTIKINNVDTPVTENMRLSADTDKDTYVTANDALLILQKAVGKNVF